jgi:hypothetical protein
VRAWRDCMAHSRQPGHARDSGELGSQLGAWRGIVRTGSLRSLRRQSLGHPLDILDHH